jgi:hypothetical protein
MSNDESVYPFPEHDLHLVELVNRVLDRGAVISAEITISVAGVDLLYLGLQLVLAATETAKGRPGLLRRVK